MSEDRFCAAASLAAGEPVVGTASRDGSRFLLVEIDEPHGPDAMASSALPEAVKDALIDAAEKMPGTRIAFVRAVGRRETRLSLWVAGGSKASTGVVRLPLASPDAVLRLDLVALLRGDAHPDATVVSDPVALVCTHGKRDRCCALHGVALASALAEQPGLVVLESSHLGGHRFAAVVVTLPNRFTYGHLGVDDAVPLAAAIREGRIFDVSRFRGRAGLDEPTQVADAEFLARHGTAEPPSVESVTKADGWVELTLANAHARLVTRVRREELAALRPASCFDPETRAYRFVAVHSPM